MKAEVVPVSRLPLPSWSLLTARLADFVTLMKPRVMSLAVFTALVGLMIARVASIRCWGPFQFSPSPQGAGVWRAHRDYRRRRVAVHHVQLERRHDAAARADEFGYAALNALSDRLPKQDRR
jgi:hypothetical protein